MTELKQLKHNKIAKMFIGIAADTICADNTQVTKHKIYKY